MILLYTVTNGPRPAQKGGLGGHMGP